MLAGAAAAAVRNRSGEGGPGTRRCAGRASGSGLGCRPDGRVRCSAGVINILVFMKELACVCVHTCVRACIIKVILLVFLLFRR